VTSVILQAAAKLCRASMATLHLRDGDVCHLATQFGMSDAFEKVSRDNPIPVHRPLHSRRQARAGEFAQFADAWNDPEYLYKSTAKLGGYRAILIVPMMRENELIGLFSLGRPDPEPFTADQIKLIQTFSDQAVIAIENARLFNETKEALARQTATSEILRVISQSPTDSRPVFDRIIETAMHVLHCEMAVVLLCEGGVFFTAAAATTEGLVAGVGHTRVPIDPDANFPSRAIVQMTMVHLPDWSLIELPEHERKVQERWGINSSLYLPLLREGECIGVVALVGKRANSFGPREVAQAESFRDQALIAIENARLFGETQEALEQQKASADVLGAISKSVADTAPVFEAIVDACQRLFGGEEIGWEGALATVVQDSDERVFVVLYDISETDETALDRWDAATLDYYRKLRVRIATLDGATLAWLYVLNAYEGGLPSARYLGIMADAAEAAGAPDDYVSWLRGRPCVSLGG